MSLYKVLEVTENATHEEIRKSYRRLARKYHPDSNQGDKNAAEKFKEISEAYNILGDEEKRKKYDEERLKKGNGSNINGGRSAFNTNKKNPQFSKEDLFSNFFFGQNPFKNDGEGQEKPQQQQSYCGYNVDKQSINNQFANFFGFGSKKV